MVKKNSEKSAGKVKTAVTGTTEPVIRFDVSEVLEAQAAAEEDQAQAEKIGSIVLSAIAYLATAQGISRGAREKIQGKIVEAQEYLASQLRNENPTIRRSVWKAYLTYELTQPLETIEEAEEVLSNLVKKGILTPVDVGPLQAFGKSYSVAEGSLFEDPEMVEVKKLFAGMVSQTRRVLQEKASLTAQELLKGVEGLCLLHIPSQKVQPNGNGNQPFWRPGGNLVIQSRGGKIFPVDAMGKIEVPVRQASDLRVSITLKSLSDRQPPFFQELDEEKRKKIQLFWYLVHRGIQFAKWIQDMSSSATISEQEFFEGKPGKCLVDLKEAWRMEVPGEEPRWMPRPVFLIERTEENGKGFLSLLETPPHLADLFGQCMSTHLVEGEKFGGCPQPLQAILRSRYGVVTRNTAKVAAIDGDGK